MASPGAAFSAALAAEDFPWVRSWCRPGCGLNFVAANSCY
jgi:hypothetical protein